MRTWSATSSPNFPSFLKMPSPSPRTYGLNSLPSSTLKEIDGIVRQFTDAEPVIFGSWAQGRAQKFSDIDLCLMGPDRLPLVTLGGLKEAFIESNIPYIIDVSDYHRMPADFQAAVQTDGVPLRSLIGA